MFGIEPFQRQELYVDQDLWKNYDYHDQVFFVTPPANAV